MDAVLWGTIGALGALLMRVGFAVHGVGMARSKNSAGAIMRHLCDLCVATLAFWAVGYAIMACGRRFLGLAPGAMVGLSGCDPASLFFSATAVLVATGIVPGILAERARFWPTLGSSALLAAIIAPIAGLWTTRAGWLGAMGFTDWGGAGWLHLTGALCGGVGAVAVGARTGKFNRDGSSTAIPGHSVPLAGVGVLLLFVGFVLFAGRTGEAAVNVLLAGAAGGLASVMLGQFRYYKPDVHLTYAGVLGGLVAISAGSGSVPGLGAVLIGAVAGVLVPMAILTLDVKGRVDDPSGAIAVHGVGAVWGLLATPLLARGLPVGERLKLLGVQALGVVTIGVLTIALSAALWAVLKRVTKLRASEADEFDGLDLAEHDIGAYPDFQQTMIKSYHLREV
jgi:Amt family ammonium transporter